jgi:endonuclease-3
MTPAKRESLFAKLRELDPHPKTELVYSTPFELLVAVILSAQATDKGVNIATARLFPVANTPEAIISLGLEGIKSHIRTIGLYNAKAENIFKMCHQLLDHHGGEVPHDRAALESLAGVGRKTANVILNCVFGEPTMAVDTHIFRVSNRTGLAPGKTVGAVEKGLLAAVPKAYALHAHHWLILLGRYTCKARRPECWRCPVQAECGYKPKEKDPDRVSVPPPRLRAARASDRGRAKRV